MKSAQLETYQKRNIFFFQFGFSIFRHRVDLFVVSLKSAQLENFQTRNGAGFSFQFGFFILRPKSRIYEQ